MVAAFSVLSLVVSHLIDDFHLACTEIALEIGGILQSIPQAELNRRKSGQVDALLVVVGDGQLPDFQRFAKGDKVSDLGFNPSEL